MEFYEIIKKRKSVRKYKSDPIPEDVLNRILDAGRMAPSAKNYQPWHFIVVRDPEMKKKVAEACRNQPFMAEAGVIICGCALEKIAWGRMGNYMASWPHDLTIALDHIILAATNEGLGTCWIGAFDEKMVKDVLGIPDDVRVVALTPVGYPAEEARERGRLELKDIVSYEKFETSRELEKRDKKG
ncbi:nitroreductase [candidate division WOR_3 bacterium SM23_42]|uniref:Nitroreductase n=1 Tax=candidate division WOR_3 bacterium SM23_42 TaxID=1703779 RepID=A0A0S8FUH2_UNCW3|nr:MAG: nitroreductase [candidate division WOR_3 bacterium SM23_42]